MKTSRKLLTLAASMFAFAAIMTPHAAMALTDPCTVISNQATLDFKVGNVSQTQVDSGTAADNTEPTTFTVGVKILVTVALTDVDYIPVTPSDPAVKTALSFSVTNDGNSTHNYALSGFAGTTGVTVSPFDTGTADFQIDTLKTEFFVETAGGVGYQVGDDTNTVLTLAPGESKTVYVVYSPDDLVADKDDIAVHFLKAVTLWANDDAITLAAGNGTLLNDADLDDRVPACAGYPGTGPAIDVVAGDGDGDETLSDDASRDGKHSAKGAFEVVNAVIKVVKGAVVYSDPINGVSVNAKAIPGAVVTYTITATNSGNADATDIQVDDDLTSMIANIDFGNVTNYTLIPDMTNSFNDGTTNCKTANANGYSIVVTDGPDLSPTECKSNSDADADDAQFSGNTVTVTGLSIPQGKSAVVKFQVTLK